MQYHITLLIITFSAFSAFTQSSSPQQADYNIYAKLDTSQQKIEAQETVLYHNNSEESLSEIWFHLWANAYSSKNTSLAKELIEAHDPSMYFLKQKELGGYSEISFRMGDLELTPHYTDDEKQIVRLTLNRPLPPGAIAEINIHYTLKIPKNILGYGYDGGQFILANWYPKIAAYRDRKWEVQTLNRQNLFSADAGKYHVTLAIPEKYTVVSSGTTVPFHVSENLGPDRSSEQKGYKIVSFAHPGTKDFVWIADTGFYTLNMELNLENGGLYQIDILYDNRVYWDKKGEDIKIFLEKLLSDIKSKTSHCISENLVIFASQKVERPMAFTNLVTTGLLGKHINNGSIQQHREILAQNILLMALNNCLNENPFEKPWMYLGLKSYYFTRFMDEYYPSRDDRSPDFKTMNSRIISYFPGCEICFKSSILSLNSYLCQEDLEEYLVNPTTIYFNYLEKIMGKKLFDQMMLEFFSQNPEDIDYQKNLRSYLEKNKNENLDWFFDDLLGSSIPFSYEILKIHEDSTISVEINNTKNFAIPYFLGLKQNGKIVDSLLVQGHQGKRTSYFSSQNASKVFLDPFNLLPENKLLKQSANINKPNRKPFIIQKPYGNTQEKVTSIGFNPFIGFNVNDGIMPGVFMTNSSKNLDAQISPMFGWKSKKLTGLMLLTHYLDLPEGRLGSVTLEAQSFHRRWSNDIPIRYYSFRPSFNYSLGDRLSCDHDKIIQVKFNIIGDQDYGFEGIKDYQRYITNITFWDIKQNIINPHSYSIGLEYQYYNLYEKRQYLMVHTRLKTSYMYKKDKYIHARLYGATYLFNSHYNSTNTLPGTLSLIGYNMNDYAYDYLTFFDRSAQDGFWSRQISMHTGGFKTAISNAYGVGQSNRFVASVNLKMDLPFGTFIKPFFDFGVYGYLPTVSEGYSTKTLYSAGLIFSIFKDNFEIYLPLINSKEIEDKYRETYEKPFWGKFSFSFVDFNLIF